MTTYFARIGIEVYFPVPYFISYCGKLIHLYLVVRISLRENFSYFSCKDFKLKINLFLIAMNIP